MENPNNEQACHQTATCCGICEEELCLLTRRVRAKKRVWSPGAADSGAQGQMWTISQNLVSQISTDSKKCSTWVLFCDATWGKLGDKDDTNLRTGYVLYRQWELDWKSEKADNHCSMHATQYSTWLRQKLH
ncbi:hypothetical protein Tco_0213422 [Tanacetum coccineum]